MENDVLHEFEPKNARALGPMPELVGGGHPARVTPPRAGTSEAPLPPLPAPPGLFRPTAGPGGPGEDPDEHEDVDLEDRPVSSVPRRYKVVFHNDDYTTQEFVILVLMRFFHKGEAEARHIMLTVHFKGAAVAGVYTRDVAETKAQQVMDLARENGMPLLLTTEPE